MKKIFYNGNIISMNKNNNIYEAILIEDGKITDVGSNDRILTKRKNAEIVDLQGKTILPSFIDPHGHIVAVAQSSMMPNVSEANSVDEIVAQLQEYLKKNPVKEGKWLLALGYDNSRFKDGKHPTKFDLDKISSEIPIFINHASGHITAVNSKALEIFGYVGEEYIVPEGGVVNTVEGSKEPNGVLEEQAFLSEDKKKLVGGISPEDIFNALLKTQELYASYGIATCQDASIDPKLNQLLKGAAAMNMIKIDIIGYAIQPFTKELMGDTNTFTANYYNHYKLLGGKTWLDGSPQGKTAWLTKPYYVVPVGESDDYKGYGTQTDEVVTDYLINCIGNNIQVNAHCNGDAASDQFIRCYKEAVRITGNSKDLRPVMVHSQTVREDQLDEMKEIGMIPTFFLDHIWYWGDYHYESVLGPERAERISPAASALKRGMNFTLHQDPPVKMPNMLLAIHNAVNRKTQKGRVLGEEQKISVIDAIRAVTINSAYQIFEEDIKGSLEVEKVADLVIIDKNPLEVEKEKIKDIKVLETIKEGNTVYSV